MFNNNFNSNSNGWSRMRPMGTTYSGMRKAVPKDTQALSESEQKELMQKTPAFTTELTREEILRSRCTHRKTGVGSTLMDNHDGTATCTICGTTIQMPTVPFSEEDVRQVTDAMLNILNLTKSMYYDIDPGVVKEFFQIMPYIARVPALYKLAVANCNMYDKNQSGGLESVYGADSYSFWNQFDALHTPGGAMTMGGGMMGTAPVYDGATDMSGGYGMPAGAGMVNPFFGGPAAPAARTTPTMGAGVVADPRTTAGVVDPATESTPHAVAPSSPMATTTTTVKI